MPKPKKPVVTVRDAKVKRANLPPFDQKFIDSINAAAITKPAKREGIRARMRRDDI
jgi:hypothetical protein